ncbi:transcriptional repressor [Sphingobacterium oryzagri]|uniref:Transcriptional repressor n=1 Tax=Sphingobacterium oryzagri TaxID=3025669 RepID=A0ABY7WMH1_9SPHI|nr:transcriptional repressor [Sphingobacterium sp. KACC 22765]WDF69744.1 transcriptional repressor [Sphingobacterium sp. KACC 22765]
MHYNKTQLAILDVLREQPQPLFADDIFMQLNPVGKCYSYAAIYRNIQLLCEEGILVAEKTAASRRKAVQIVP